MARQTGNQGNGNDFTIYEARIHVELVRKTSRYDSDSMADVTLNEQFPLTADVTLENAMDAINSRITEVSHKVETVLLARGEFERKVMLTLDAGDVDAS